VGLLVWMLWPRRLVLAPPLPVLAKLPSAPLEFPQPAARPAKPKPWISTEPLTMKLVSDDESIVIYWVVNQKGEDE
jgi:hypothetical protein